ncbi:hypothetical protein JTB14_037341 [Gonioctena quinquepunctata]|nr:hypothetical protein JTB14_037341 [Gonioctena quinquepunctata]
MAILELERDVRESELCDIVENGSVRSTYDIDETRNLYPNVRIVNPCENHFSSPVSEWVSQTQKNLPNSCRQHIYETNSNFLEEKSDENNRKLSDIQLLCKSLGDTIRAVSSKSNRDPFMARQTVERDFPI